MPIDETVIRGIQARLLDGDARAPTMLYAEARRMATILLKAQLRQRKMTMTPERCEQIEHDAASHFVARYLRPEGYHVERFAKVIRYDVLRVMSGFRNLSRKDRPHHKHAAEKAAVSLDTVQVAAPDAESYDDPRWFARELEDDHARGGEILLRLFLAQTFPQAVREVADIAGRAWCYDNAVKLRAVYRYTRRRRCKA